MPIIYAQLSQRGISPEDSERLLLRPVETQLKSVGNVKEMRSTAFEGGGYVLLEFEAGFDSKSALADVRAKVDQAKRDLPKDVDEPSVQEVNLSLYPVLVVALAGDLPERTLLHIARTAKNAIEQVPGVLSAELRGARDEAVEIIAEPMLMKSYGVSLDQFVCDLQRLQQPDRRRRARRRDRPLRRQGAEPDREARRTCCKVPLAATAGAAVTLGDVAQVKPTFKDATSVTRVNGQPAMTIEVSKRTGANLIETVDAVKAAVEPGCRRRLAGGGRGRFTQDKSKMIRQMLADLQNSVATGVLLVVVIILFALGFRASLFIGIAIPASFLAGVLGLQLAGLTVNIVVLFSLILAVGMLVDDAIIVSEFAERRMAEGMQAEGGLCARGQAHVRPGDRGHRDPRRGLLAAAVLARHRRRVHEISADHADRDAVGVARGRAVLHADAGRAVRQGGAGRPRRAVPRINGPYMRTVRAGVAPSRRDAGAGGAAAGRRAGRLWQRSAAASSSSPASSRITARRSSTRRGNLSLDEKNRVLGDVEKRVLDVRRA